MNMTKKNWTLKRFIKTIWISAGIAFTLWLIYSFQSHGVDQSLLRSSDLVSVENRDDFYAFTPTKEFKNVFIFYPGAMVASEAYIPLCRKIADNNIKVFLIKMPWRLASRGYSKPRELNLFADTSKTYTLAGHSQGAKMAAQFAYEN